MRKSSIYLHNSPPSKITPKSIPPIHYLPARPIKSHPNIPTIHRFGRICHFDPRNAAYNSRQVNQEYNIDDDQKSKKITPDRSTSLSNKKNRFREIKEKYSKKLDADAQHHSRQLAKRRRESPKLSLQTSRECSWSMSKKNSTQGSKTKERKNKKVIVSLQKCIKIGMVYKSTEDKPQKDQKMIQQMEQQLQIYRYKYEKALRAINRMDKLLHTQENKFNLEKQLLQSRIEKLNHQLQGKISRQIPHLYTYKQADENQVKPNSIILESQLENLSSSIKPNQIQRQETPVNFSQIEKVVEQFLLKCPSKNGSSEMKSHLSIDSK